MLQSPGYHLDTKKSPVIYVMQVKRASKHYSQAWLLQGLTTLILTYIDSA